MFGIEDVKCLVECAGRALETEDRHLVNCFKTRQWKCSANGPGICDNMNERYYQLIIWRELMSSFPWLTRTERQDYDLAFYDSNDDLMGCAEIKGWWSESGETELPGIRRDLKGKLGIAPVPGVMLILTSQLVGHGEDNYEWLANQLGLSQSDMVTTSFPVSPGLDDAQNPGACQQK